VPTEVTVTFAPDGASVRVGLGATVSEAALRAGVLLSAPCAGRGVCGGCGVRVLRGELAPPDEAESAALRRAPAGVRLACRARVAGDVEVRPLFSAAEAAFGSGGVATRGGRGRPLAAGVDLGTTSVAARVADARSGRELGSAVVANRQAPFGADVLSRLTAALEGHGDELQALAVDSVREALSGALRAAGDAEGALDRVAIAGNSVMSGLLLGADVSTLASHPFVAPDLPRGLEAQPRAELGLPASVAFDVVRPVAAFVGGDAMAGILAAGLVGVERPSMLVDIGTNAEVVLALPGKLLVTSAAAGPAFEASGISCGGPATPGAVIRVHTDGAKVALETIGGVPARWFSGAGIVSAVSALRAAGHLTDDGRLLPDGPLRSRFSADSNGVLQADFGEPGSALTLTQLDVRALQLAKAAVRVGIESLLREARLASSDLAEVLIAGAFGEALEPDDLAALGIVPSGSAAVTRRIGNAALAGATALALDSSLAEIAAEVAASARHVDLAADEGFGAAFLAATAFSPYD
jgi:uncharacterized 2Fe-2S/4Fe-4S cluster protein (DUF4445 family)